MILWMCERMRKAIRCLEGEHDFSSFRASGCDAPHPTRTVYRTSLDQVGELLVFTIEATAFLRHMARNIVGTLVEVGRGLRAAQILSRIAGSAGPNQSRADGAAPWVVFDGSEILRMVPISTR